ncbi:hypothetical protein BSL78_16147 [Apostichopus japonicus]|uniref:Ig-like domain-containing protein n=1 Tax=Stichopus japonicus TaxID=307972 RepID=A0A2G8KG94_STIJA|nr:hypothetical protein BSL78_16147 [Apostichopus japonicus]
MHDYTVSILVLKCYMFCLVFLFVSANAVPSVEFYFYDPYGTNGLVFVGEEGSLFCEAKDISDLVFTLTFNGSQIFDGKEVATEYADRIQVEESDNLTDTFRLQVFESPHCRDKGSRRFTQNSTDMIRLECIHLTNQTAKLTLFSPQAGQLIAPNNGLVKSITFENNKVIEQFFVNSASDGLLNFTCEIGSMNVKSCNINITALLLTSQSDSMPKLTKVKSSTCKSNVSFGMIDDADVSSPVDDLNRNGPSLVLVIVVVSSIISIAMIITVVVIIANRVRTHNKSKDGFSREVVNRAFAEGSVSKMDHPSVPTDLGTISNSKADSRTSHSYDNVDELPRVPYDDEFNAAEHRYTAASNLSSDKSYYSSTLYYES